MIEVTGDFWQILRCGPHELKVWDAAVCPINTTLNSSGALVMGAGLAKDFKEYRKYLDHHWGAHISNTQNYGTQVLIEADHSLSRFLIGFPTKTDWRAPSNIDLITRSALQLRALIIPLNLRHILMPRVGCGLGGLDWNEVKPVLHKIFGEFSDRFTIVERA